MISIVGAAEERIHRGERGEWIESRCRWMEVASSQQQRESEVNLRAAESRIVP